ncbi:MAG: alpha/beta fold hydrolase [Bacteroidales bacterium]|nr:alpha/beta fold hydrolase [Bacteroidales bacterium]
MRFSEDRIEKLHCSDGILRDVHIWEPAGPRAVFLTLHGLMDHGGNYKNPGLFMKEQGYALVAPDQQGHDRKRKAHVSRFDRYLDDLQLMLDWVKENYKGLPVFIMGHSMGGLMLTHFGIRRFQGDPAVKGFIMSAPGYENSVRTSGFLIAVAKFLSVAAPKMAVPIENLRLHVTRDEAEYKRMREDEKDGIQATRMSARLGAEFLKAQEWVPGHMDQWKHPLLVILPGADRLINPEVTRKLLSKIEKGLVTVLEYPDNYHESFNELNRKEVFTAVLEWCQARLYANKDL